LLMLCENIMRFMWMKKNSPMQPGYYIVQKIDDDDELYEISFFSHNKFKSKIKKK